MQIKKLRVNHIENPLGYSLEGLSFSWIAESETSRKQSVARIEVAEDPSFSSLVFDSGKEENASSLGYEAEFPLAPCTRYFWRVTVWDEKGESAVSETAFFETAKMEQPWEAKWICADLSKEIHPVFRKTFTVEKEVKKARVYVSGVGIYEFYLNGEKVGDEYLAPGYHSYDFWQQYQTYDITEQLKIGKNAAGAMVGVGWYKGRLGFDGGFTDLYGDQMALIAEIHIAYMDGTSEIIVTDESWKSAESPVITSGIYDGEIYDANKEIEGWCQAECDESVFTGVKIADLDSAKLTARLNPMMKVMETRGVQEVIYTPKDELVLDFGQNMAGWVTFKCHAAKGEKITLQYGEILQQGCFYRENLRTAKAELVYISDGKEKEVRPHFTYYGFRYVKVEGISKEEFCPEDFTCCTVYSEMEQIGTLTTGREDINRLVLNALWGEKSNFFDVPTDCPQRDERLGWTGDAQIFSGTACYNMYTPVFFNKFMKDMLFEQSILDGSVPHVIPRPKPVPSTGFIDGHGASPWADSSVIIPWNVYLHYGDKNLLRHHYENMKQWLEYVIATDVSSGDHKRWMGGFHFADWLALDNLAEPNSPMGATDNVFVASAYYYYIATIVSKAAKILGYEADAERYGSRAEEIKKSIQDEYFSVNGRCTINTQTALVLALHMNLLKEEWVKRSADTLVEKIKNNNGHLNTGFVGTPYIAFALTKTGNQKLAYDLLLKEDFPSWLYAVKLGATTIWERWNSVLPDGSISGTGMNSLNHYSYGSIVEWLYRDAAGMNPMETGAGFKKVLLAPKIDGRLGHLNAELASSAGLYKSSWKLNEDGSLTLEAEIPFDCEALWVLPDADAAVLQISCDGEKPEMKQQGSDAACTLYAGKYSITYMPTRDYIPRLSVDMDIETLFTYPEVVEILKRYTGRMLEAEASMIEGMKDQPLQKLITNFGMFKYYNPAVIGQICAEIGQIKL